VSQENLAANSLPQPQPRMWEEAHIEGAAQRNRRMGKLLFWFFGWGNLRHKACRCRAYIPHISLGISDIDLSCHTVPPLSTMFECLSTALQKMLKDLKKTLAGTLGRHPCTWCLSSCSAPRGSARAHPCDLALLLDVQVRPAPPHSTKASNARPATRTPRVWSCVGSNVPKPCDPVTLNPLHIKCCL
jgi:hypothetical protein